MWYRGLRGATNHSVRYRYSVAKAKRLLAYTQSTSTVRHLVVVFVYVLPGLVSSAIPTFVALQDPDLGALHNPGFFVHGMLTTFATFGGATLQARAVTSISHRDISTWQVIAITVVGATLFWVTMGLLGIYWRFPVPFTMVMAQCLFQILFYPIYSTFFEAADQAWQVVLIALFPICKYYLKRAVAIVSHHLGDYRREVGVAGVEICASIYQATIMQNTPSIISGVLIVLVDVLQGLIDAWRFLSTDPAAFSRAVAMLQDGSQEISDASLAPFASPHIGLWRGIRKSVGAGPTYDVVVVIGGKRRLSTGKDIKMRELTQALETLQSMETILMVEYIETIAPIANTVYLIVAAHLKSALYNPRVRDFYVDHAALTAAVGGVVVYSLLQAATLAAMCLIVRGRFQMSALALLAFVLETHAWSLQGKLIAWFTFMFAFTVVHYGVDFSFKFDFRTPT